MLRNSAIIIIFQLIITLIIDVESQQNNLLQAYFSHRAAQNSMDTPNNQPKTNRINRLNIDYDSNEAREPGSFVKLRDSKDWLGQPVSPHRDDIRAASMIRQLRGYTKRLAEHIARTAV